MRTPADIALHTPRLLLPAPEIDLHRWAVIACDQYTSEPQYWQAVEELVGKHPSTLHITLPEIYLNHTNSLQSSIHKTIKQYLNDGTLVEFNPGWMLLRRGMCCNTERKGLLVALDLEHYDYRPDSCSLIRPTEGTIADRLPPRMAIRREAELEVSHVMVLIDDPQCTVIEPLFDEEGPLAYQFELMMNSGYLEGRFVRDFAQVDAVVRALSKLAHTDAQGNQLLFAVGDGNHSLATAKALWEELKASSADPADLMDHPARYALVELVNLHDPSLQFEAIHRVLFGVDGVTLLDAMHDYFAHHGGRCHFEEGGFPPVLSEESMVSLGRSDMVAGHRIPLVMGATQGALHIDGSSHKLATASLQAFLDDFLGQHPQVRLDYVHGADTVNRLGSQPGHAGFFLPPISKESFFPTILQDGPFPRKTFSMGHSHEKRFYLECRRIR
ncbi:DUF1015 domain-containing protein [Desulfurispira natronophila]|uniref:DUF1015 domain-containing protein n=1 Tax=Desulfurispira natronophila TaxID=682562 RepID=A0A7W8DGS6_9BACT|nr:DUF1015 domain-containing protein [Desulfurispira natronophila]MBB5021811.1 hypothetical protein [Desulfurispira natronophila]